MKKILFLLLLSVAMYGQVPADATPLENIQITNNQTSTTATKVNVQENDGTINTKPISDLVNYLEFASAVNLPVTGEQGKLYLTKDNNKIYRWNGTIYQELTTDISGKEDIANKQNSLAVDGTNTKYPTVTAVNTGLALKANLASPTFTGTPTAPTATAGTNTTQIATTAFVTGAISTADSGNVKLIGNQTIAGVKTFSANTSYPLNNGVQLNNTSNNSTYGAGALLINNNGQGFGSSILNNSTGYGLGVLNMSTGSGLQMQQSSNGRLISLNNLGAGIGISLSNTLTGTGIRVDGASSGNNFISGQNLTGTGFNYVGQNNGLNTFTVDKLGATTATSFIKSSAPTTNILLAGGGDIAQNTAFNKNFGTTAGTVVEGGTLGSNAYSSTAYLPIASPNSLNTWSYTNGFYGLHGSSVGMPSTSSYWSGIRTVLPNDNNYGLEITANIEQNELYFRRYAVNYKSWQKLWHDGNFNPANYLPLSGGNISGTVGIGTTTPNRKLEVADTDSQFSLKGTITGAPVYQTWYNISNVRRGFFGFASASSGDISLVNEEIGNIYISPNNGSTIVSSTVTATSYTATSLPVFENNASASSLAVGQFYRTSTGVLMVKF